MSDVIDGVWSVIVRYIGKECMYAMAPIRYVSEGGVEELPVEFTKEQAMTHKSEVWRAEEAQLFQDALNGGPCRECRQQPSEDGVCPCDWDKGDDADDIAGEVRDEIIASRKAAVEEEAEWKAEAKWEWENRQDLPF